jgi:APA family basic amino acid/polyamine antiporter
MLISLYIPGVGNIYPLQNFGVKCLTIIVIVLLTWVNYRSTHAGSKVQVLFTSLKVAAMTLLVFGIAFSGKGSFQNIISESSSLRHSGGALVLALVAATSGAFWGYDGWNNITFVAGEIKDPQQNIPRSLLVGLLITIAVYCAINLSYIYMLPIDAIAKSSFVGSDAATEAFGVVGGGIIALLVIISTFGTTNGNILATARVSFAMAREKRFFSWAGKINPKYHTPGNALVLHGTWTSLLVLSGSFDMLTDMLVFVSWLFYGLSAFGVFILRRTMPNASRPYRVWGYPWMPGGFVLTSAIFLSITFYNDVSNYLQGHTPLINSLFGLLLTVLGIPLYFYFRTAQGKN